jgi:hypothetical protein
VRPHRFAWFGAAALATCFAVSTAARAEDPPPGQAGASAPDADAQAAKWLKVGNAAFKAGDFAGAEKAYREAFAVKRGYDIAGNLGTAELAQGKLREAAQHLAFTLRLFPITGEPGVREQMQKAYDQCRQSVSAVRVKLDVKGAQVLVDGAPVGEAPLLVEKGAEGEVTLVLTAIPHAVTTVVREVQARRRSLAPGLALAGVAVVGVGAGVAFLSVSSAKKSDAENTRANLLHAHESCVTGAANFAGQTSCGNVASSFKADDTFHDAAVGAFVVGAAAAVGTALYFLWPVKRTAPAAQTGLREIRVTPVVAGSKDGGLLVSGSF